MHFWCLNWAYWSILIIFFLLLRWNATLALNLFTSQWINFAFFNLFGCVLHLTKVNCIIAFLMYFEKWWLFILNYSGRILLVMLTLFLKRDSLPDGIWWFHCFDHQLLVPIVNVIKRKVWIFRTNYILFHLWIIRIIFIGLIFLN